MKGKTIKLTKEELKKLSNNPFKYNRKTTKPHIKTMIESINKWGILRNPIIGRVESSGVSYIADGQHLVKAVVSYKGINELNCTVVSVSNEKELIHLIADLNTSSKAWGYPEFLNSWLNFGSDNLELEQYLAYYKVNKANESTSLSLALIVDILCKDAKKFKTGKAELKDENLSILMLKTLDKLKSMGCPAHQLYGAKSYIDIMYKRDELDVIKLTERIGYLTRCKDSFIPSNREQFKHYLFGLMECNDDELRDYVYGKWILLSKTR